MLLFFYLGGNLLFMKKAILLPILLSSLLFTSCGGSSSKPSEGGEIKDFFKEIAEDEKNRPSIEKSYYIFYDLEENRFNLTLSYDSNLGVQLQIVEYDLYDYLFNANEGHVSEDYKSISFRNDAHESSDLFGRGEYTIRYVYQNKKNHFYLDYNQATYELTTEEKENPHYIYKDLVGSFYYADAVDNHLFDLDISVGSKEEHYPVTISLVENNQVFIISEIAPTNQEVSFKISGLDASYIKATDKATLKYSEITDTFNFKINDSVSYNLTKEEGTEPVGDKNYFLENGGKIMIIHDDFEIRVNEANNNHLSINIKEKVEGGLANIFCICEANEKELETMTNAQNIGSKGKLFHDLAIGSLKFEHYKFNGEDYCRIYFSNQLQYQCSISTVSE